MPVWTLHFGSYHLIVTESASFSFLENYPHSGLADFLLVGEALAVTHVGSSTRDSTCAPLQWGSPWVTRFSAESESIPNVCSEFLGDPRCRRTCLVTQLCPILCNPMPCSLPGSSVHGILQARILEWVAFSSSMGSSWYRNQNWVSCIAGIFFTTGPPGKQLM